ncbi:hypothetical protein SAMN05443637_107173 [Pseudonocardia thermophila]|uniref:DUF3040 domain-containing protein n=1 Tax=Pseudonocardia thermophila TaxID=1848 RepID=A0A1M6T5P4_PSETH|nr:hypothetical protein [Pseudonocardia thermophila]SHK52362.1 hypothetical protein SAMN05443637_107173 [Pseudonocardia thermophila]
MNDRGTDERLRDALQALAAGVPETPEDFRAASSQWRRRERRRRIVLAVLATVVFVVADGLALWALNQADPDAHVIFSDPAPGVTAPQDPSAVPPVRAGQP